MPQSNLRNKLRSTRIPCFRCNNPRYTGYYWNSAEFCMHCVEKYLKNEKTEPDYRPITDRPPYIDYFEKEYQRLTRKLYTECVIDAHLLGEPSPMHLFLRLYSDLHWFKEMEVLWSMRDWVRVNFYWSAEMPLISSDRILKELNQYRYERTAYLGVDDYRKHSRDRLGEINEKKQRRNRTSKKESFWSV